MLVGIILSIRNSIIINDLSSVNLYLALSILGAIMYLMVFEAGRSRYLISFLPVLILFSAIGYQTKEEKQDEK